MCINITILDDNALEGYQNFIVILFTEDLSINLGNDLTSINIEDDDG